MTNDPRDQRLIEVYLRVRPEDIAYIKFIVESYEFVGVTRTVNREKAIIGVYLAPDFAAEGEGMLRSIEREISVERVPRPREIPEDWLAAALAEQDEEG